MIDPSVLEREYRRVIWRAWRRAWVSPLPLLALFTMVATAVIPFTPFVTIEGLGAWIIYGSTLLWTVVMYVGLQKRSFQKRLQNGFQDLMDRARTNTYNRIREERDAS